MKFLYWIMESYSVINIVSLTCVCGGTLKVLMTTRIVQSLVGKTSVLYTIQLFKDKINLIEA
jgi:hypothetical protein